MDNKTSENSDEFVQFAEPWKSPLEADDLLPWSLLLGESTMMADTGPKHLSDWTLINMLRTSVQQTAETNRETLRIIAETQDAIERADRMHKTLFSPILK